MNPASAGAHLATEVPQVAFGLTLSVLYVALMGLEVREAIDAKKSPRKTSANGPRDRVAVDAPPRRAKCGADGDFAPPRRAARPARHGGPRTLLPCRP